MNAKTLSENDTTGFLLEDRQRFSQSLLWDLQKRYYDEVGAEAWRDGDVPQYVTSSPRIADAYAQIVFAARCDLERQSPEMPLGRLTLCELGAGSGRFAFHFLARLSVLCADAGLDPAEAFRYVLTDFTQSNVGAWYAHPSFAPHFESGLLDVSLFDVTQSDTLELQVSGQTIRAGDLAQPLIVIANYLFDTIAQELFYIDSGRVQQCRISLASATDPDTLNAAELITSLEYRFDRVDLPAPPFPEPQFAQLLDEYRQTLSDTYLLFPAESLRCLHRLRALSASAGLILLVGDKGDHRLEDIQGRPPPGLVRHGSFSLTVNYHALAAACRADGGQALFSDTPAGSVNIGCLLWVPDDTPCRETHAAFRRTVGDFGPDDFYAIARRVRAHTGEMTVRELLALLRLSLYDAHQFDYYLPRLTELAPDATPDESRTLRDAVDRVWSLYFHLGEDTDLAYGIGGLLYALSDYPGAIAYFERSVALYGPHTGAIFNVAACCSQAGRPEEAVALLQLVLDTDPDNESALALLAQLSSHAEADRGPTANPTAVSHKP